MTVWNVREEHAGDVAGIHAAAKAAFTDHPHSAGAEPEIIARLRADGDLALSLVAEAGEPGGEGAIIGHAAWSAARLSSGDEGWLALGPISVIPERQRTGVGRTLILAGHARLRGEGVKGVVLLGDPGYYSRFGFRRDTGLTIAGPLSRFFQVLPFTAQIPVAQVTFAPAFGLVEMKS